MTGELLFSSLAWADLRDIACYVGRDNPGAAEALVDKIQQICRLLADNPEMGQAEPNLARGQYRSFVEGSYVIYYLRRGDGITVARILHAAREHGPLL